MRADGTVHSAGGTIGAPASVLHPRTGVYCVFGSNWSEVNGAYVVTLQAREDVDPGRAWVNSLAEGMCYDNGREGIAVGVVDAAGDPADRIFVLAKLS
jgi:hypothetical protein